MITKFNIDAVQASWSNETHKSHNTVPKFHSPSNSYISAGGITYVCITTPYRVKRKENEMYDAQNLN